MYCQISSHARKCIQKGIHPSSLLEESAASDLDSNDKHDDDVHLDYILSTTLRCHDLQDICQATRCVIDSTDHYNV